MPEASEILETEEHVAPEAAPRPAISFALRWLNYLVFLPLVALATVFFGTISLRRPGSDATTTNPGHG